MTAVRSLDLRTRILTGLIIVVAIAAILRVSTPRALPDNEIRTEIPFPFQVGRQTLQPGIYGLTVSLATGQLLVANTTGAGWVRQPISAPSFPGRRRSTARTGSATHAHVVFEQVGPTYALVELRRPGTRPVRISERGKGKRIVIHVRS